MHYPSGVGAQAVTPNAESPGVREERLKFEREYEQATPEERERLIEEWAKRDRESRRPGPGMSPQSPFLENA